MRAILAKREANVLQALDPVLQFKATARLANLMLTVERLVLTLTFYQKPAILP